MTKTDYKLAERCLQQFNTGLSYREVAAKNGIDVKDVTNLIAKYRKKHGLRSTVGPRPAHIKKMLKAAIKKGGNGFQLADAEEKALRVTNFAEAERRKDGVLVCPPRYAYGYRKGWCA